MDWTTFWGAFTASSVVAGAGGWLAKSAVDAGIKHTFERQIETLKSELRDNELAIQSLRSNVLGRLAARNQELDKRRLNASSALWAATVGERQFAMLVAMVSRLNIPAIREITERDPVQREKIMQLGEFIWMSSGLANFKRASDGGPDVERLFLPADAWLMYEALRGVGAGAIATVAAIKTGAPLSLLREAGETNDKLKAALPHQVKVIEKYPYSAPGLLVEELEQKILASLMKSIEVDEQQFDAIEKVAAIPNGASRLTVSPEFLEKIPEEVRIEPPVMFP